MAQRHVSYAAVGKVLQVGDVIFYGKTVLYAQHNALLTSKLVALYIVRSACKRHILRLALHYLRYLVEYEVSVCLRRLYREVYEFAERLSLAFLRCTVTLHIWLWQIAHHEGGVKPSLSHLVKINEYAWVALGEVNTLMEEHRRVAVSVERQHARVHLLRLAILPCPVNEPLEQWQSVFAEPFRMPLHSDDALMLRTLHCLYVAIL